MKKILLTSMFSVLGVAFTPLALAGFIENAVPAKNNGSSFSESSVKDSGNQPAPVASITSNAGVVFVGNPQKEQPYVRGFAKDVSLLTALKQIVPMGWNAKKVGDLDMNALVSWRGQNRSWTDVLAQLAKENQFVATLNWETNELMVEAAQVKKEYQSIQEVATPKEWVLRTDLTLKDNVAEWAKKAGWTLSWVAVDYPVTSTVVFPATEIDSESGPLRQIVEAYKNAEQPITVSFWTNKVIRVENAAFKQSTPVDEMPNHRAMR